MSNLRALEPDEIEQFDELVGVIATFGFLNRWNDTFATTLEEHPTTVAERTLAQRGWDAGKHGTGTRAAQP